MDKLNGDKLNGDKLNGLAHGLDDRADLLDRALRLLDAALCRLLVAVDLALELSHRAPSSPA